MEENETKKTQASGNEKRLNFILKIVSVFLAFVLWFYVARTDNQTYKKEICSVPISVFTSEGLTVIQGSGATVDVTVSGTKSVINSITADNLAAYTDMSEYKEAGRYTKQVEVTVSGIEGVTIVSRTPENLSVYLDKTTTVTVPVEVKVFGYMLDDGYEIGEAQSEISEIAVSGPEAELLNIDHAVANVELDGVSLKKSLDVSSALKLVDDEGNEISATYVSIKGEQYATVHIPIYLTRSLPLYADYKYGYYNDSNVSISFEPSSVTVTGLSEQVSELEAIKAITIDEKSIKKDTTVNVSLKLPDGLECTDGTESVSVSVKNIGTETKTVVCTEFNIINSSKVKYEAVSDSLTILVRGEKTELDALTAADITVDVDMSSVISGTGTVKAPASIKIDSESFGTVYELGEYYVSVKPEE